MFNEVRINEEYASLIIADGHTENSKDIIRKNLLRTSEFFSKLTQNKNVGQSIFHNILPENCRYIKPLSADYLLTVVEEQPSIRTILIDCDIYREIEKVRSKLPEYGLKEEEILAAHQKKGFSAFTLAFPYIVSVIVSSNLSFVAMQVFVRKQPLLGLQDTLFYAPLYNIPSNQWICIGDSPTRSPASSLPAFVRLVNNSFWNNRFNYDYIYNIKLYSDDPFFNSLFEWQYYTQKDPMFVFSRDYKPFTTISNVIDEAQARFGGMHRDLTIGDLNNIFTTPKKETIKTKTRHNILYSDIVTSYFINEEEICVGDNLETEDGKIFYVDSFLGFDLMEEPDFIRLVKDKNPVVLKLHEKSRTFLKECIKRIRYKTEIKLPNGVVIKPSDYISYEVLGKRIIKLIKYIRKAPDERVEIRTGDGYYSLESIPKDTKIFDVSNIDFHGIKLNKNSTYISLIAYQSLAAFSFVYAKFTELNISSNGQIAFKFNSSIEKNFKRPSSLSILEHEPTYRLIEENKLVELPDIVVLGRKLTTVIDDWGKPGKCFSYKGRFVYPKDYTFSSPSIEHVFTTLLKDDIFEVQTPSIKINFSIGDKVVCSNWANPIDMLKVKTITGIVSNKSSGNISFALLDKEGNTTTEKYIEEGHIAQIGRIRKITNVYNDLKAGSKIIANETGISCFPKKDVNIIVGFIIDSGASEPFVLCSNGCTLWYSDVMEKFDIIQITNKKWKALQHAPIDTSKIKLQPGDIINCKGSYRDQYGYLLFRQQLNRTLKLMRGETLRSDDYYYFDSTIKKNMYLDCIPEPRINQSSEGTKRLQPTYHGTYVSLEDLTRDTIFMAPTKGILNNV